MTRVLCKNCGDKLDEMPKAVAYQRTPCPRCGSRLRLFQKYLAASITPRGGLRGVAFRTSKTKWFTKFLAEPSFTHRLGLWSYRLKVENKRSNQYLEVVTNPETGEILHHCSESLTEHRGHGTAEARVNGPNDG